MVTRSPARLDRPPERYPSVARPREGSRKRRDGRQPRPQSEWLFVDGPLAPDAGVNSCIAMSRAHDASEHDFARQPKLVGAIRGAHILK